MTLRIHFRAPDRSVAIETTPAEVQVAPPVTVSPSPKIVKKAKPTRVRRLRTAAYVRQKNRCYWCGKTHLRGSKPGDPRHPDTLTAEHLVRRADGGQDTPANVVVACAHCNRDREQREDGIPHVRVRAITRPHVVCEATG